MFRIITIEREFGSGAGDIARELASRLGWKLWDNSVTEEIARLAQVDSSEVRRCDERMDSSLYRLAKVFWRGSYERSMPVGSGRGFDTDCMVEMMKEVIEKEGKPLTDSEIVERLKERGIQVARRTVAKYRMQLAILPSSLR